MGSAFRRLIEHLLPWYLPAVERQRDAHTARIARRSEIARLRAERVIRLYQTAEASHDEVRK